MSDDSSGIFKRSLFELLAVAAVIVLLVASGALTCQGFRRLQQDRGMVQHTHEVLLTLQATVSSIIDAETGQRGFIITGRDEYLEPFDAAIQQVDFLVDGLRNLTSDNPLQQSRIPQLKLLIVERIDQLLIAIAARRDGGIDAAEDAVNTDVGRKTMDQIRSLIADMTRTESDLMVTREATAQQSYRTGLLATVISTLLGLTMVGGVLYLIERNRRRAEKTAELVFLERQQLQVTLASIGDGVIVTDRDGRVSYLNPVSESLTGWVDADAHSQRLEVVFRIINEESRQAVENPAARALREGAVVGMANHALLIGKDGREIPIDDSAAPIRDLHGNINGVVLVFRDATERRAQDRRMTASATFMGNIIDGLSQQVVVLDEEWRVVKFNRMWSETFSVLPGQVTGKPIADFGDGIFKRPDVQKLLIEISSGVKSGGTIELERLNPDNELGVFRLEASRFDSSLKNQGSILLVITNLSAERDLQRRHRRLDLHMRWFLEQISDYAIFTMDANCRATSWNRGVRQVLGYEEDEFIGQDIRQLIFPPEAIAGGLAHAEFDVAARRGEASDDRWMVKKGNQRFWASGVSTAIDNENGELVGYSKVMRDLTERKNQMDQLDATVERLTVTQKRLQLALEAAEMGAWNIDTSTDELVSDEQFRNIFGVEGESLSFEQAFSIMHPDDRERIRLEVAAAIRPDDPVPYSTEYRVIHPDGSIRWVYAKGATHFENGPNGPRLISFDGTAVDVTERRHADEKLRRLAAELSEADRRKNEFLATLAHELRNPLAPIKNAVQLMGMTQLDGDTEDLRQMMARQVEQLVHLIDDLLDVSRISRGKIVLRREVIDLASIIDVAVEASSTFITENGQQLTVESGKEKIFVSADPARMTQVISNLLNNSSKYSDAGSEIELKVFEQNGNAVIQVHDNGIGIPADRLRDIFLLFSQVNDSLERGSAGLGIGLTLVKTMVEMHGGSVTAASDGPGRGSLFTVRLPIVDRRDAVDTPSNEISNVDLLNFQILIVEDQRALRIVLSRLLEKLGHTVESVESGREAIKKLDSGTFAPDIIFSDIAMPGMTGYELIRRLRQRPDMAGVYLVAMTGFGQESDREMAKDSGFDEHMTKPVDVNRLQELFRRLSANPPD